MFITYNLLEKYNAYESDKRFFQRLYPSGVEALELLANKHIPKEILFWVKKIYQYQEELKNLMKFVN